MKLPVVEPQERLHADAWQYLLASLPPHFELERLARLSGALRRRRGVKSASDLLRVALSYGFCGLSFKATAAWSRLNGCSRACPSALFRRLRRCGAWLEALLAAKLSSRLSAGSQGAAVGTKRVKGLRVRLVDASCIGVPGCQGVGWRLHADYDPWCGRLAGLQLTDGKGGERLGRFPVEPGDLLVGDRGYAHRAGLAHVVACGGDFLVRLNLHNVPLEDVRGGAFDLLAALRTLPELGAGDFAVRVAENTRRGIAGFPCRLVATRKTPEAAEAAREKVRKEARKKGRKPDEGVLESCGYFFVLTTVGPELLAAEQLLGIYRLRWQVELEFKRLKSLLNLDDLRARDPELVRCALAAKMLGALLVEDLVAKRTDGLAAPPVWALTQLYGDVVRQVTKGLDAASTWFDDHVAPEIWLAEPPRKRQPQCLTTSRLLA